MPICMPKRMPKDMPNKTPICVPARNHVRLVCDGGDGRAQNNALFLYVFGFVFVPAMCFWTMSCLFVSGVIYYCLQICGMNFVVFLSKVHDGRATTKTSAPQKTPPEHHRQTLPLRHHRHQRQKYTAKTPTATPSPFTRQKHHNHHHHRHHQNTTGWFSNLLLNG